MSMYAVKNPSDYNADYVLISGNKTYVCRLNPSLVDLNSATPIEQQAVWNITCIEKSVVDGKTVVTTKYPDGKSSLYNFAVTDCETYNYEYQK